MITCRQSFVMSSVISPSGAGSKPSSAHLEQSTSVASFWKLWWYSIVHTIFWHMQSYRHHFSSHVTGSLFSNCSFLTSLGVSISDPLPLSDPLLPCKFFAAVVIAVTSIKVNVPHMITCGDVDQHAILVCLSLPLLHSLNLNFFILGPFSSLPCCVPSDESACPLQSLLVQR